MKNKPSLSLNNMVSVYDYKKMIELQANTNSEKLESKKLTKKINKEVLNDKRKRH